MHHLNLVNQCTHILHMNVVNKVAKGNLNSFLEKKGEH